MERRADYGAKTDAWFASLSENIAPLAVELRSLILEAVPSARESIKWGAPVYEKNNVPIWRLRAAKGYVSLQFGSVGTTLDDPNELLEGTGKRVRHVKVRTQSAIATELFTSRIKKAEEK